MEALDDVVKAAKARYLASAMRAWQFAKTKHAAATNGWTRRISGQSTTT